LALMMGNRRDEFVDVVASGLMYVPNILEGLVWCARLIVVTGFAHCLQHGYTAPVTQSEIVWSGAIHLGCSVMGLLLLRFGDKREAQRISAI
jgi:hypothetical protein